MGLLGLIADGGSVESRVHHECRDCGTNLDAADAPCPACGGSVSTYRL